MNKRNRVNGDELPPHSEQAERGVLGSILLDPTLCLDECATRMPEGARTFYGGPHRLIYGAMLKLHTAGAPVDLVSLSCALRDGGQIDQVGGDSYLSALMDASPSAANLAYYLNEVVEKHAAREALRRLAGWAQKIREEGLPASFLDDLREDFEAIDPGGRKAHAKTLADLLAFDTTRDPNTLLGMRGAVTTRYLCRGQSAWLIGPSGVGKSSLIMQMAVGWAAGLPVFGVTPIGPLRVLLVQAENDTGDCSEMTKGMMHGLDIDPDIFPENHAKVTDNLRLVTEDARTGRDFCLWLKRTIREHRSQLVMLDPLLSFGGFDVSRQDQCSLFLRNWLNPVLHETGAGLVAAHHTGKPPKEIKNGNSTYDESYAGLGSSELVNWARAIMVLKRVDDYHFELAFRKRGQRAGATHPSGEPTTSVWLRHAQDRVFWEHLDPPEEPAQEADQAHGGAGPQEKKPAGRPSKLKQLMGTGLGPVCDKIPADGETQSSLIKRIMEHATAHRLDIKETVCRGAIDQLFEAGLITKNEAGLYVNKSTKQP